MVGANRSLPQKLRVGRVIQTAEFNPSGHSARPSTTARRFRLAAFPPDGLSMGRRIREESVILTAFIRGKEMIATIATAAACAALIHGPRLLVELLATLIGVFLTARSNRIAAALLGQRIDQTTDFDRKPSRADCRLMRQSLRLAVAQTQLRSLLPATITRAEACAHRCGL